MSTLKDRLRADLTTAIKARDDIRSSTLRMVLTAVTNAEVAGTDQEHVRGHRRTLRQRRPSTLWAATVIVTVKEPAVR